MEAMNVKKNITQTMEEKQFNWFGHAMGMGHERLPRLVFEWEPERRRRRG